MFVNRGYILEFALGKKTSKGKKINVNIEDSYKGGAELFFGVLSFCLLFAFSGKLRHELLGFEHQNIIKLLFIYSIYILVPSFLLNRKIIVCRPNWPFLRNVFCNIIVIMMLILIVCGICFAVTACWYLGTRWIAGLFINWNSSIQNEISREYGSGLSRIVPYYLAYIFALVIVVTTCIYSILFLPLRLFLKCLRKIQHLILKLYKETDGKPMAGSISGSVRK